MVAEHKPLLRLWAEIEQLHTPLQDLAVAIPPFVLPAERLGDEWLHYGVATEARAPVK